MIRCIRSLPPIYKGKIVTIDGENALWVSLKDNKNNSKIVSKTVFKKYFEETPEILLIFKL